MTNRRYRCILFDWGDTLMRVFPQFDGPMISWPQVEAMPYAAEILTELHPHWTLALATNAAASHETEIRAALNRVGLEAQIDKLYCYRTIGHPKPSPAFFEYILQDLHLSGSQVVMVGDDFERDVIGANNVGIRAIWYNPSTLEEETGSLNRTIHDLRSLPGALYHLMEQEDA